MTWGKLSNIATWTLVFNVIIYFSLKKYIYDIRKTFALIAAICIALIIICEFVKAINKSRKKNMRKILLYNKVGIAALTLGLLSIPANELLLNHAIPNDIIHLYLFLALGFFLGVQAGYADI